MRVFRSEHHSFWHDDISNADVREKLRRRIRRFERLVSEPRDLLFVIQIGPAELSEVSALHGALCRRFVTSQNPHQVLLVVITDSLRNDVGPVVFQGQPNVAYFSVEVFRGAMDQDPFARPIASALGLALDSRLPGFGVATPLVGSAASDFPAELSQGESRRYGQFGEDSAFLAFEPSGAKHIDLSTPVY